MPPSRRHRSLLAASLVLSTLAGCSTTGPELSDPGPVTSTTPAVSAPAQPGAAGSPSATADPRPDVAGAQQTLDALLAAGTGGDRQAWDARVSDVDPRFATRSTLLFANLRDLPLGGLRVRLTGTTAALDGARRTLLGEDARVFQGRLSWRLPDERADATATVWLTVVGGPDGDRLAGTEDGDELDAPAEPLWWLAPTTQAQRGRATVLTGPGQDAERWARLAARAADDVHRHLPAPLGRAWDGRVVVEVPGSESDFTRVLGASPSAYAQTAAVTRPEGPTTDAALRVVVNPAAGTGTDDELGLLLTHETVHVATRSAASPAPLWAVEGLAEHVALQAHPEQRAAELAGLRRHDPAPLPPDADFRAGAADVTAAYAQAWLACRTVADRRGDAGLGRLYAALDDGRTLDEAARSALGVDAATVTRWARDAERRAGAEG